MFTKALCSISRGRTNCKVVQVRSYAKKGQASTPPPAQPKQPEPQTAKVYPPPPHIDERLFDPNPRDLFKKREFDLDSKNLQALKAYLAESSAMRSKFLKEYPEIRQHIYPDVIYEKTTFADASLPPIRVALTGAAGSIGYALLARIASGDAFGIKRRVILQLLELPAAMNSLQGVSMELRDSAFPLLEDVICTDNVEKAFEGVDYALLVGAQPRKEGMERGDLLLKNAEIFSVQGKALNSVAKGKDTRVAVVGNPANTNAMIAQRNAPKIPPENFMAMTRLDHTRALAQLAIKTKSSISDIDGLIIWGNHSATQFPDISHAKIHGKPALDVVNDRTWIENDFIPTVQKRGAAIISARKASSAASAAAALIHMLRSWEFGTGDSWTSGAVISNGEYGVDKGLFFSYPIIHDVLKNGQWSIVNGLSFDGPGAKRIATTLDELKKERDGVAKYL